MRYDGDDYTNYPGDLKRALKVDFAALDIFAERLGVTVTNQGIGTFYVATKRWINIDTKSVNRRGFVPLAHLTDEYLHAWNQFTGRGRFLDPQPAQEHRRLGRLAEADGTKALGKSPNEAFHKLEALNFVLSTAEIPSFIWSTPLDVLRQFGYSWAQHLN